MYALELADLVLEEEEDGRVVVVLVPASRHHGPELLLLAALGVPLQRRVLVGVRLLGPVVPHAMDERHRRHAVTLPWLKRARHVSINPLCVNYKKQKNSLPYQQAGFSSRVCS